MERPKRRATATIDVSESSDGELRAAPSAGRRRYGCVETLLPGSGYYKIVRTKSAY